jgi:coenzyme PQQ precursor peptide PqqA
MWKLPTFCANMTSNDFIVQIKLVAQYGQVISCSQPHWRKIMAWTTPEIIEVCVGMEVTSYASAEI